MKKTLLLMTSISFVLLMSWAPIDAHAAAELKTNLFSSISGSGDVVFTSHNTFLVGGQGFHFGGFYTHEGLHSYLTDSGFGVALRFGEASFFELQMGQLTRKFEAQDQEEGSGYLANLIFGWHFGKHIGLSVVTTAKRIEEGMDSRTLVRVLPHLGVRFAF